MRGRRYRLFTICAVVIVFLLYRTLENSWALSNGSDSLDVINKNKNTPPDTPAQPPPPATGDETKLKDAEDVPKKPSHDGLLGDEQDIEKELEYEYELTPQEKADKDALKQDALNHKTSDEDSEEDAPKKDTTKQDTSKDTSKGTSSDYTGKDSKTKEDKGTPEIPKVHWSDPPKDDHQLDHPKDDKEWASEHWIKPKENFPVPSASIIPIPTGAPKKIPKIQFEFGTETERNRNKRLHRQGRVKAELERAWSGYRKFAWMHDELTPESKSFKDPFCGWAATLVDSLDTLWIADMRDEFDEAANAVAKIDFTFTPRSDIPVFETTIRYLGGLIAAYDVSGGEKGKYPMLLNKAVELAEILMGIFDTPNRMPILYYHWRAPYSSEAHRAGMVSVAELATLSMEFTRLAQLTGTAKYYDAIDRITDALVQMQKDGETDVSGLFPEKIDASGCNHTATTLRDNLSKDAQNQLDADDLTTPPKGYEVESSKKLNARAAIPPPGPDAEKRENGESGDWLTAAGPAVSKEKEEEQTRNKGRTPPLRADGTKSQWDCVAQGLVPAQWGSNMYHMGGSQDSAYEYFPKQYLLLGGLESKYQKLHEDAVDAIDKHLLYRPMIKNYVDWDILVPGKLTKSGLKEPKFTMSHELTHLTCFVGGMYGLGGKIFNRPEDIETAKKLTDSCVWAYQSTVTGLMPETAHLADCPTLDRCKFNETYWHELLDPSKEWRDNQVAKWEEEEAAKAQSLKDKEKLREQAKEKAKSSQGDETDYDGAGYSKYSEGKSSKYDSSDDKTSGSKPSDYKSSEDETSDYKTSKDKASDYKSSGDKSDDYRGSGSDASDYKTSKDKSSGYKTSEYEDSKDKTSSYKSSKDKSSGGDSSTYKSSKDTASGSEDTKDKSYDYLNSNDDSSASKSSKDSSSDYKSKDTSSYGSSKDTTSEEKSSKDTSSDYKSKDTSSYGSSRDTSSEDSSSSYKSTEGKSPEYLRNEMQIPTYNSPKGSSSDDESSSKDTSSDYKSKDTSSYGSSKDSTSSEHGSSKDTSYGEKSSKDSSSDYKSKDTGSYGSSKDTTSSYKSSKESSSEYGSKDTSSDYKSKDSSSYGSSKDTTHDEDDNGAELKPKAVAEQKFSPLAKRDGIPMPELDTAMNAPKGESGSELPDSLKKKLGKDNRWSDDAVSEDKADPEFLASDPSQSPNQKPTSHEEFVEMKLETEKLPAGYVDMVSRDYILRPEAIESVWYMYRITGDPEWQDKGWTMFEATIKATHTEYAHSAIDDVMTYSPGVKDSMESFWTAETLKYYYLLFSEPDLISLDEWVLNTEAHPFKRPTAASMEKLSSSDAASDAAADAAAEEEA
ncbi:glycosyl hydrolase family 47-domain-containing protein [Thelonectria olida]|uniref:alpha-1,2-Mannosidase n=1 Tax=Thelonectria olida TaxID=1576542 RepID=A0A9P9AQU3_9HYPO|nr:glycosyl hydrolase family 47-domain-containing protein [Thelonectria olida]